MTTMLNRIQRIISPTANATQRDLFTRQLYNRVPVEDLAQYEDETLKVMAGNLWEFIQERRAGTPKIRVINPTIAVQGWESRHTVVEMVNDDMPFLVDSVTEAFNRLGLTIHQLIHPVLRLQRNDKGKLDTLLENNGESTEGRLESVIHLEVTRIDDKETITKVENEIRRVLGHVRLAVEDWQNMVVKMDESIRQLQDADLTISGEDRQENIKFLKWMRDGNFIFLGYAAYRTQEKDSKTSLELIEGSELGILKSQASDQESIGLHSLPSEVLHLDEASQLLAITKSNQPSIIHRPVHMDCICLKSLDPNGQVIGEYLFIGLFTSKVYFQSALQIPLLRKKIETVFKRSGFPADSHNGKEIVAILESFPRDELFQSTEDELLETAMGIVTLAIRRQVKLFIRKDQFGRFVNCLVFVPRERYSTQLRKKIQIILERAFSGTTVTHYTQITDSPLARLQLILKTESGHSVVDTAVLEENISEAASIWEDDFRQVLIEHVGDEKAENLSNLYIKAFPLSYTNRFSTEAAYTDLLSIERLLKKQQALFDLYKTRDEADTILNLKIFNLHEQIPLASIMPILGNMGLKALDSSTYAVNPVHSEQTVWVHYYRLDSGQITYDNLPALKKNFEEALSKVWQGTMASDGFNSLIVRAGLQWREVTLLRTFCKYLRQVGFTYSQTYIEEALAAHPLLAKLLAKAFYTKFDPSFPGDRLTELQRISASINQELASVSNVAQDKIIRRYLDLINAALRTNFFQPTEGDSEPKDYISIKFRSTMIPELPQPHPHAEIFVYSQRMEGIHLRGGEVARGGLRWSDRFEDFRTEILGLMKAQMTKNAVIVPVGSKGGFVVKNPPPASAGRDAYQQEGIECYKTFLRGLLDITDNMVGDRIVAPEKVVRHDDDDPYLVVAADKGTATFSDIANSISAEYHFWLGDAFASGGSAGYDHKKMAITARGAWISVQRHFREMGIDTQSQDFTVAGIGDMAGDVFGNGMLRSRHIKLVAAFNHAHIFLDPTPEAEASFKERERLFNLPRSSWKDYNPALISKGGGVFERSAKTVPISEEVRALLAISDTELSPDELIQTILKAPIDLLWNGGIGTYVKAKFESHQNVGDRANDTVRVNGSELRFKVVGEGGNLGFTQLGRIEYAQNGGRLNTDAIDNSAGVDCSDHEVNIKIALGKAVTSGKLSRDDRNKLLEQMTDEVAALVLRDNQLQTQALTIAQLQGRSILEQQARFMRKLEKDGLLKRKIEFLPDDEEINRLHLERKGLTRPEIAVLLAYSKIALYKELLASDLPDDLYFHGDLMTYFPKALQQRFEAEISSHRLRREIIATVVTNSMVNRVGITFCHHMMDDTGMRSADVARAYTVTRDAFELRGLWRAIEALDGKVEANIQFALFIEIQNLIERVTAWFLRNYPQPINVAETVERFRSKVAELSACLEEILSPAAREGYQKKYQRYIDQGVPAELAKKIAGLIAMASAGDIVEVATRDNLPVRIVGQTYFTIGTRLHIGWLRSQILRIPVDNYWDRLSLKTLVDDLYDHQRRITADVIKYHNCDENSCDPAITRWLQTSAKEMERYDAFIEDFRAQEGIDLAKLVVAVRRIEAVRGK